MSEIRVKSTGTIKLFESDNTSSVTIASPASLGGDRTITIPDADVNLTNIATNTAKTSNATHSGEVTGATALTIADNIVDEANLKVSNAPTNGYALTAQSGNTGGMTWASVGGTNTPSFFARSSSSQTPSNNTSTLVVLGTEVFDTDSAFASNTFTVPSGKAGKYFFQGNVRTRNTADVNDIAYVNLFLNGSSVANSMAEIEVDMGSSGKFRNYTQQVSVILDLSVGNTVQLYAKLNVGSGTPLFDVSNFMGYKLI